MKKHVELVGILFIALHSVLLLTGIGLLVILSGIGLLAYSCNAEGGLLASSILSLIGLILSVGALVISLPGIIAGIGLLKMRPWARFLTLILSALNLINIPFGTVLGVYAFWVLMQDETIKMFKAE